MVLKIYIQIQRNTKKVKNINTAKVAESFCSLAFLERWSSPDPVQHKREFRRSSKTRHKAEGEIN